MHKRLLSFLLAIAMLLSLISCGEYKPATGNGGSTDGSGNRPPIDAGDHDPDSPTKFTVQLMLEGQPFVPDTRVDVYWNDGYNIYSDTVDDNGYASVDGLDGDYSVYLSSIPQGYAYNPNDYVATNDNRNIVIEIEKLNLLMGAGTSTDDCYIINDEGVYTITVTGEGDYSYIRFAPQVNGVYTVESWVSTVEDEVNPLCKGYLGSSHYVYGEYMVDTVGKCGSYTRNFIHTVKIADENISSGGSQTFTFGVSAETKSGIYPVNVTFRIENKENHSLNRNEKINILSTQDWSAFDFDAFNALAGGKLVGAETLYPGTTNSYVFDEENYKLWKVSEGGDGVYHVYDKEKYPETNGYGPILVVYITVPCRYIDRSFTTIEDAGNSALVVNGTDNYRLMIKGFAEMASQGYFCVSDCLCHDKSDPTPACLTGCTECHVNCVNVTEAEKNTVGYSSLVNADGVAPVTPEIVEFLQGFAITQRYFADGDGWVEKSSQYPIDAYEDSQWLFACAYYEE